MRGPDSNTAASSFTNKYLRSYSKKIYHQKYHQATRYPPAVRRPAIFAGGLFLSATPTRSSIDDRDLVKTTFPRGQVATIPSAIPKNPVGSYQHWTDCMGESTCAFVQTSRTPSIRNPPNRRGTPVAFFLLMMSQSVPPDTETASAWGKSRKSQASDSRTASYAPRYALSVVLASY